jgi:hypothetical protein
VRKQIWIPVVVVLTVCLLLLFKTKQHQRSALPEQGEALTNQPSRPEQPKVVENQRASNALRALQLPQTATPLAQAIAKTNPIAGHLLAAWQGSIEFYGKVVDENSNAVAGANASFHWVEMPTTDGNRSTNTKSDTEGLFSLHGQRGLSLGVSVSKEGYYSSRSDNDTFVYGSIGGGQVSPDPVNPAIFHLRKKGVTAPLVMLKRNYGIPRDGTPFAIDLVTGHSTTGENGNLVVRCWTDDQGKQSGQKYDWRCLITVPGGGIEPTDEEFAFQAPKNGYALTNEISMPADCTNWTSQVDLKFFYRLADGRYGRMTFSIIAGGQHFCMIDSVLNPTGSRNLEPIEIKSQGGSALPPGVRAVIPEFK